MIDLILNLYLIYFSRYLILVHRFIYNIIALVSGRPFPLISSNLQILWWTSRINVFSQFSWSQVAARLYSCGTHKLLLEYGLLFFAVGWKLINRSYKDFLLLLLSRISSSTTLGTWPFVFHIAVIELHILLILNFFDIGFLSVPHETRLCQISLKSIALMRRISTPSPFY